MGFWSELNDDLVASRKDKEALYAAALREMEAGIRRDGLWGKALENAKGNEERVKAEYIKLVVRDLRDQRYVVERNQEKLLAEERMVGQQQQLGKKDDGDSTWVWRAVLVVFGALWLYNKGHETQPVTPNPPPQRQTTAAEIRKPEIKTIQAPPVKPSAPAITTRPSADYPPPPREPCVFKQAMTNEEIRRCKEAY